MKKYAFAAFLIVCCPTLKAIPIGITDLGPSRLIHDHDYAGAFPVSKMGLSGIALDGHRISFDITFGQGHFLRSFTTTTAVGIAFRLPLDGNEPIPPFGEFSAGRGYFTNQAGHKVGSVVPLIGAFESYVSPFIDSDIVLFGSLTDPGLKNFYGFHFDFRTSLPGATIQENGRWSRFEYLELSHTRVIGIGPHIPADIVPDSSSTLFLLSCSVVILAVGRKCDVKTNA